MRSDMTRQDLEQLGAAYEHARDSGSPPAEAAEALLVELEHVRHLQRREAEIAARVVARMEPPLDPLIARPEVWR